MRHLRQVLDQEDALPDMARHITVQPGREIQDILEDLAWNDMRSALQVHAGEATSVMLPACSPSLLNGAMQVLPPPIGAAGRQFVLVMPFAPALFEAWMRGHARLKAQPAFPLAPQLLAPVFGSLVFHPSIYSN